MRALCNREGLLAAFAATSGVVPARSPKPILQNVKLVVGEGATLEATDLEVAIRARVLGVKVDRPGSVILPTQKVQSILRTCQDDELSIDADADQVTIRGLHAQFKMPTEDPDLFPECPEFTASAYHVVPAAALKAAIRATAFATDVEATRYALGGVLFEGTSDSLGLVATDGRRLAKMTVPAEHEGGGDAAIAPGSVVPTKALNVLARNLDDDDPPAHVAFAGGESFLCRTADAVLYSRLVAGRFPRYQDVFPTSHIATAVTPIADLAATVAQASILTSEESRGVDFAFAPALAGGVLKLTSKTADVGGSDVDCVLPSYSGPDVLVALDPRYVADFLKAAAGNEVSEVTIELVDGKNAVVFRVPAWGGYAYVVMPLTRER